MCLFNTRCSTFFLALETNALHISISSMALLPGYSIYQRDQPANVTDNVLKIEVRREEKWLLSWLNSSVTYMYKHYWRPRLCRVFLHSAALGKVRSAKFFSAKGLCRVLFIGALGKIKKNCRVLRAALGKIFSAVAAPAVNGYFAECPTQHSAKKKIIFFKITFPSSPAQALDKVFFLKKITLPSARAQALVKVFFIFFLNNLFAECPCLGTRQRISDFF